MHKEFRQFFLDKVPVFLQQAHGVGLRIGLIEVLEALQDVLTAESIGIPLFIEVEHLGNAVSCAQLVQVPEVFFLRLVSVFRL